MQIRPWGLQQNSKDEMYRSFTYANTRRYVDVLDDLVHPYNNTYHRSIGMAPAEVNIGNEQQRLYPLKPKSCKWKYQVGDSVRIVMQGRPFRKDTWETGRKRSSRSSRVYQRRNYREHSTPKQELGLTGLPIFSSTSLS